MEKDYIVKRKDIYVGEVVKATGIYKRFISGPNKAGTLDIKRSIFYRNMLFSPTVDKFASDLLYDTEDYPILNGTDRSYILNQDDGVILVNDYYNLDELLEYFCYNDELDINDVIKLYNTFFSGRFSIDNCFLFGRFEVPVEKIEFYHKNKIIMDGILLEKYRMEYRKLRKNGKGLYFNLDESILPRYYFSLLQKNKNSFKPSKEEGKIKKLTRF